jgi:ABC-type transporter Mla MlaB component
VGPRLADKGETVPTSKDEDKTWRDRDVLSSQSAPSAGASGRVVDLDVSWLVPSDLGAVDALARLQVVVSRCGRLLRLHGVDGGLAELLEFVGLSDVMHLCRCCRGACSATLPGAAEPRPT